MNAINIFAKPIISSDLITLVSVLVTAISIIIAIIEQLQHKKAEKKLNYKDQNILILDNYH